MPDIDDIVIRPPRATEALAWDRFVAIQQTATYGDAIPDGFLHSALQRAEERAAERQESFASPGDRVRRVAVVNDRIIGVAEVGDGPQEWELGLGIESIGIGRELSRLYLADEAKGLGLGATLLREVAGSDALYLWIINGNERAHRFYRKHGFTDVDETVSTGDIWGCIPMHRMTRPGLSGRA